MKKLRFSRDPELNAEMFGLFKAALTGISSCEQDVQAEYDKHRREWNELGIFGPAGLLRAFGIPLPAWAEAANRDHSR